MFSYYVKTVILKKKREILKEKDIVKAKYNIVEL